MCMCETEDIKARSPVTLGCGMDGHVGALLHESGVQRQILIPVIVLGDDHKGASLRVLAHNMSEKIRNPLTFVRAHIQVPVAFFIEKQSGRDINIRPGQCMLLGCKHVPHIPEILSIVPLQPDGLGLRQTLHFCSGV